MLQTEEGSTPSAEQPGFQTTALVLIGLAALAAAAALLGNIIEHIETAWQTAEEGNREKALLDAYHSRGRWRKADVPKLLALEPNDLALRRIDRLSMTPARGRGILPAYRSLGLRVVEGISLAEILLNPQTAPNRRVAVLKRTPLWPTAVEALYRGEHAAAKAARLKSPSETAHGRVAECFGISEALVKKALVKKICTKVRRQPRNFSLIPESLRVSQVEHWKCTGDLDPPIIEGITFH